MPRKTVRSKTAAIEDTTEAAQTAPVTAPKRQPAGSKASGKPAAKRRAEPAGTDVEAALPQMASPVPAPAGGPAASAPGPAASAPGPAASAPGAEAHKAGARKATTKRAGPKRMQFDEASLASIHQALTRQRADLVRQLSEIEDAAFNLSQSEMSGEVGFDEDSADAGSSTFEREKDLSIANNVSDLRSKIDRALRQIEEGSYGICVSCGQAIEGPRLKALPHVTLCLKCKKLEERR